MKKKTLIAIVAIALVVCLAIGGTLAYLLNVQDPIKNIFTIGKVDITLDEEGGESSDDPESSDKQFTIIPNTTVTKDATVTVGKNSLDAYVFAVVDEKCTAAKADGGEYTFGDYVTYTINSTDWTKLDGYENVYYLVYTAPAETPETDTVYHLITDLDEDGKGDIEYVDIDQELIDAASADGVEISLSFQAGAVQSTGIEGEDDAEKLAAAWDAISEKFTVSIVETPAVG